MQKRQLHSDFHFRIYDFKYSKDELILMISGTLLEVLGVIHEIVSVPYLTVLGFLEQSYL